MQLTSMLISKSALILFKLNAAESLQFFKLTEFFECLDAKNFNIASLCNIIVLTATKCVYILSRAYIHISLQNRLIGYSNLLKYQ